MSRPELENILEKAIKLAEWYSQHDAHYITVIRDFIDSEASLSQLIHVLYKMMENQERYNVPEELRINLTDIETIKNKLWKLMFENQH